MVVLDSDVLGNIQVDAPQFLLEPLQLLFLLLVFLARNPPLVLQYLALLVLSMRARWTILFGQAAQVIQMMTPE